MFFARKYLDNTGSDYPEDGYVRLPYGGLVNSDSNMKYILLAVSFNLKLTVTVHITYLFYDIGLQ